MTIGIGMDVSRIPVVGSGGSSSYAGFPATDANFAWRTDDSETDGSGYVQLYDITGNGNNATRPDAAGSPLAYGTTLDGYTALDTSTGGAGRGLNLTSSISFNGQWDVFLIAYVTGGRTSMFTKSSNEGHHLFSKEAFWRENLTGSVRTLWNSPPDNSWQCLRCWRDSGNDIHVSLNGAADSTPGAKIYADTGTVDRLIPHDSFIMSGRFLELFGLNAGNFTGAQLTAAYTYINSRYPSLSVTIP